jgi:hypothetical protein
MLQVRFGQADIAGAAHAKGTHSPPKSSLRSPLAARTAWQRPASLPTPGGLERFMLGLRSDRDGPPLVLLCRADTVDLPRAATASGAGELDLDHLIGSVVDGRSPTATVLAFGTDRLPMFPIDEELAGINPLLRVGLPLDIATRRTKHFDPIPRLAC